MRRSLIQQLYSNQDSEALKTLFETDPSTRPLIKKAIGNKIITSNNKIITSNAIDALFMMCLMARFADSEDECNRIAMTIYQYHDKTNAVLPSLSDDRGLVFSGKCLVALSFYPQRLEHRYQRYAAPAPGFYRQLSKAIYKTFNQNDISAHHEQWETFLGEVMI